MGSSRALQDLGGTHGWWQGRGTLRDPTSPYLGECQHLQHIGHVPLGLRPAGVPGRGMREWVGMGVPAAGCPRRGVSPSRRRALTWSHAAPHGNTAGRRPAWGRSPHRPRAARRRLPPEHPQRRCWQGTPVEQGGGRRAQPAPCRQRPRASTHLGFPVQLLGHGGGGHGHGHGPRSCHLALLVPGLLFPLRRQMDEVGGCNGLDVLGREEPRPAVDGPELPPCAGQTVGMAPGWQPWGSPPKKPLPAPSCPLHPKPFPGGLAAGFGWKRLRFGIAETRGHKAHHLQGRGAAPGATQGGNLRGASLCMGSVPKRAQTILLRGDRGRILPRAPAPGGDTAQGSACAPGTCTGTAWHPPKSWVPVFSSSRYITFLRTTQP